jgi:hypothetical protein
VLCLSGCADEGERLTLSLRVHTLRGCELPDELRRQNLELFAQGDFEATNDAAEILPLGRAGAALKFPPATQAVVARIADGVSAFTGYAERAGDAGLDLLLWPARRTCVIRSAGYPGRHGGQGLGFAASSGRVLVAGGNDPLDSDALVGWAALDTATGALDAASADSADSDALAEPRAFASITELGSQLLVSGGEKPVQGVPERDIEPYATAEIFDVERGFTGEQIALHSARTHHAALTLADGRTLLVGGRTKVGRTSIAQYQLEIIDPASKRASVGDAITARIDPTALRLSDDRIFVGGGTALDGSLATPAGEWLTPAARRDATRSSLEVAPRFERAFVATAGGGVLAVGGCEDRPPASNDDAQACARCSRGCVPLEGFDAWWLDRDGVATPVTLDGISAPRPRLLPGSDGSPWLVAAETDIPDQLRLFRFNAWARRFEPAELPAGVRLPRPGMPAPLALAPDAFVWLDESDDAGELLGLRLGTRGRYAQDLALVLQSEPLDPDRPRHLVPTGPLGDSAGYDGKLTLRDDGVSIQVADTDYADVTVRLKLAPLTEAPPVVQLGTTALGGAACPWPTGDGRGGDLDRPTIVRRGRKAWLRFHGASGEPCAVEPGRLTLALTGGDAPSVVSELEIVRDAD